MADNSKKPKDIRDLKARLGRGGAARDVPSSGPSAGVPTPVPPPPGSQGFVPPPGGIVPPPGPQGSGMPGPILPTQSLVRPPFAPATGRSQPPPDPFAAQAAPRAQEVRLVFDDRPVEDSEVGRKGRRRLFTVVAIGILVGLACGFGAGNLMADRKLWNLIVRDGRDIYEAVNKAEPTVSKAQQSITKALEAASPAPGTVPSVDLESLRALKALKKPFDAGVFARRHYKALKGGTVDALFEYYNNVNLLWERFDTLVGRTETNKAELERAAKSASELASVQYGCILMQAGDTIACGLGVVNLPPRGNGDQGPLPTKLAVAQRAGGRPVDKTRYQGQELKNNASDYVVLVDTRASLGVLGQQASAFGAYRKELVELKKLVDKTVEVQGTLLKDLGEVKNLQEVFAL